MRKVPNHKNHCLGIQKIIIPFNVVQVKEGPHQVLQELGVYFMLMYQIYTFVLGQ